MPNKPILHRRDHERGGSDPIRLLWTDEPPEGGVGTGFNDAIIDVTWTYLGGIFGLDTNIPGTISDGTTPGFWLAAGTGTAMVCGLEGSWSIDIVGTVTHSSTTAPTIVRYVPSTGSAADMFSVDMAAGASEPLAYTTAGFFAVDDSIAIHVTHATATGTPSSTLTGTIVFTLEA